MKLIVGGVNFVPGYTTVDINGRADVIADIRLRWPFPKQSVEIVFASHVIEHISREEILFAICECSRIIKPGGILRLSTPDLDLFARKYVARDTKFFEQPTPKGTPRFPGQTIGDRFMFVAYGSGHQWLYDFDSLRFILEVCGFVNVERKNYRESTIPEVDMLDNRPNISLFVEAVRGNSTNISLCHQHGNSAFSWSTTLLIKARLLLRKMKWRTIRLFLTD